MENITNVHVTDYIPTIYTTPCRMTYTQNGKQKEKELFIERNGVIIVVYNKSRNTLILVKQFRAAAYFQSIPPGERRNGVIDTQKYPIRLGITLEFCAGLEDKTGSSAHIAKEEIEEECGYEVELEQLEEVCCYRNLTEGSTSARTTLYYCEVTDAMRKEGAGGGVDDELIEVMEMTVEEVVKYAQQEVVNSPMNFMACLYWFLNNKYVKH